MVYFFFLFHDTNLLIYEGSRKDESYLQNLTSRAAHFEFSAGREKNRHLNFSPKLFEKPACLTENRVVFIFMSNR
nr:MAG TPA: hypothetical protein [Bacteriophage sp.]